MPSAEVVWGQLESPCCLMDTYLDVVTTHPPGLARQLRSEELLLIVPLIQRPSRVEPSCNTQVFDITGARFYGTELCYA